MDKKILCLDIGAGTKDILFYDSNKNIENCISLILPSPTTVFEKRIKNTNKDLFITGRTIGGGRLSKVLKLHLEKGYKVYMSPEAARTIRDDLDRVKEMGIEIQQDPPSSSDIKIFHFQEVNLLALKEFLLHYNEDIEHIEAIAVGVQDHGSAPAGISDRVFRFEKMKERIEKNNLCWMLSFWEGEVPIYFSRMQSIIREIKMFLPHKKILIMDTTHCAVVGCVDWIGGSGIVVNIGNSHTLAAIVKEGKLFSLFEHHTAALSAEKLRNFLLRFIKGDLTSEEILEDGGHGVLYLERNSNREQNPHFIVTGPCRKKIEETGLSFSYATPGGNMMLTGPLGLLKAYQQRTM